MSKLKKEIERLKLKPKDYSSIEQHISINELIKNAVKEYLKVN